MYATSVSAVNFILLGNVTYARLDNPFGLGVGSTVIASGKYDDPGLFCLGPEAIPFSIQEPGNTLTIQLGNTTLDQTMEWNYDVCCYPALIFNFCEFEALNYTTGTGVFTFTFSSDVYFTAFDDIGYLIEGEWTDFFVTEASPAVEIRKLTNGNAADDPDGADVPRIAVGEAVIWTYEIENTGDVAFPSADLLVSDNQPGVTPSLDLTSDDGDMILSPGEVWTYTADAQALDLGSPPPDIIVVAGCNNDRNTYQNTGTITVLGTNVESENTSHYCNPDSSDVDSDGDGLYDQFDNCILTDNTEQCDADNDGYGNACDPDFDNDLIVNAADLAYLKAHFFSNDANADLDCDGVVNAADLAILKLFFFSPPGPSGLVP